jgi:uncharacterized damage-inducible protein DinB
MEKPFLTSLARYNSYANGILLETAAKIPYGTLESTSSPSRHSALTLLKHTFDTQVFFLAQLQGKGYESRMKSLTSMEEIQAYVKHNQAEFEAYVNTLDNEAFAREVEVTLGGQTFRLRIGEVLLQVFMHSAQHRGELSILLSSIGYPLPIADIIAQFIEESGQVWVR